jgi:phosphohistidine phosphatase
MQLLIIRHAIAEDRAEFARRGKDDEERPLTAKGAERMRQGALGLQSLLGRVDILATSPLRRARQTADIVQDALKAPKPTVTDALAPGRGPEALAAWLDPLPAEATVAVVGHEPDLSELVGWLLGGQARSLVALKKGAACLLDVAGPPGPGNAQLLWLLTPKQLRTLGG